MNLNQLTIKQAGEGLRKKEFSVFELVNSCLKRIEKLNPDLNAFITTGPMSPLAWAKQHDKTLAASSDTLSPLFGIPIAYKDIFSTKGTRTTAASKVLSDYEPAYNATAVERLMDAGTISVGKTNLDAWAHGSSGENSDFGPTKNPWNTEYVPGGSSSGSAVAVASDMALAATGTDTGGSIRLPASFTNIVGLKPTYGLVSRYGIIAMASSLDSIGHFTKTVEDSALILSATAGKDGNDTTLSQERGINYTQNISKGIKDMKIGIPKEYVAEGIEPEVKQVFENAIKIFEKLGAKIEEVSLPHTKYGIAAYYIIQPSEVSSNLGRYDGIRFGNERDSFGDEAKRRIMLGTFTLSAGYYDAYYKKALKVRTLIVKDYKDAYKKVDAIIAPVSPTLPWKLGAKVNDPLAMYLSDALTVCANIAGIPSLAIPAGFSNNLPVGIQIMGNYFSEQKLFQIGYAFEQETEFYKMKPKI